MRKPLPNALDIDIDGGLTEEVTPHAGGALLVELGRRGVMAAADHLRIRGRPRLLAPPLRRPAAPPSTVRWCDGPRHS